MTVLFGNSPDCSQRIAKYIVNSQTVPFSQGIMRATAVRCDFDIFDFFNFALKEKFMDTPFVLEQVYDTTIEKVWRALTNKDEMREWYFPQLQEFEPTVGYEF